MQNTTITTVSITSALPGTALGPGSTNTLSFLLLPGYLGMTTKSMSADPLCNALGKKFASKGVCTRAGLIQEFLFFEKY